jgi:hypothetical protein
MWLNHSRSENGFLKPCKHAQHIPSSSGGRTRGELLHGGGSRPCPRNVHPSSKWTRCNVGDRKLQSHTHQVHLRPVNRKASWSRGPRHTPKIMTGYRISLRLQEEPTSVRRTSRNFPDTKHCALEPLHVLVALPRNPQSCGSRGMVVRELVPRSSVQIGM